MKSLLYLLAVVSIYIVAAVVLAARTPSPASAAASSRFWQFQSVDTVKYSRDLAREKLKDAGFDAVIDRQVKQIADTGATHVAVGTPYDEEFLPFLSRWVSAARKYGLKVWYRGNWSGWEGWFGYARISRSEHLDKTRSFIVNHRFLFETGDAFTACPECENGGPGDPRRTGDVAGHRRFLIDLHTVASDAFRQIDRQVDTRLNSANGDIVRLVFDRDTTAQLGGLVVPDHYVATPDRLASDIAEFARLSGGQVILGEFGVPIPDIHGRMSAEDQARWLAAALPQLSQIPELIGLNYWTGVGGSTAIWTAEGQSRPAAITLTRYYSPPVFNLQVKNVLDQTISEASVAYSGRTYTTDGTGQVDLPLSSVRQVVSVSHPDYQSAGLEISDTSYPQQKMDIVLQKKREGLVFKLQRLLFQLTHSIIRN